jgi:serine protease Do
MPKSPVLVAAVALGLSVAMPPAQPVRAQAPPATTSSPAPATSPAAVQQGFAALARAALPAVVTITAEQAPPSEARAGSSRGPADLFPPGSPFRDFFDEFFGQQGPGGGGGGGAPPGGRGPNRGGTALGSGFIVDSAGYVVTNNHVVEGASEIAVTLADDRRYAATLVGTDPATDIAVLKIEAGASLPVLAWGDSEAAQVGDWVVAVGNPFGLGGTVTAGIISARAREIGAGRYDAFLQTDAAINTGNSGGPLMSAAGQVIGVNTAIFSRSGGSIGIGFAVPSSIARPVVAELRERGTVTRGFLGVGIQPVTPPIAEALGMLEPRGVLVSNVQPDTPAARAGLQAGDVILSFAGRPVTTARQLSLTVAETPVGQEAEVRFVREGRERTVQARIERLQPDRLQAASAAEPQVPSGQTREGPLGLTMAPLSPQVRERLGLAATGEGAVIVEVAPGSPAAERGLRPGDVIRRVGAVAVDDPGDVVTAVREAREARRANVLVLVEREGNTLYVPLPTGQGRG